MMEFCKWFDDEHFKFSYVLNYACRRKPATPDGKEIIRVYVYIGENFP